MRKISKLKTALSDAEMEDVQAARAAARRRFAHYADEGGSDVERVPQIDPDNPPMTDTELSRLRSAADVVPGLVAARLRRKGDRPTPEVPKVPVSIRLDADLVDLLRASGEGWQMRVNTALRKAYHMDPVPEIGAEADRNEAGATDGRPA